jgi:hypothetical protein
MLQTSNKTIDWQSAYKEKLFQFNLDNKNLSKIELEDNSKATNKDSFLFNESRNTKSCYILELSKNKITGYANITVEQGIELIKLYNFHNTHNHYFYHQDEDIPSMSFVIRFWWENVIIVPLH